MNEDSTVKNEKLGPEDPEVVSSSLANLAEQTTDSPPKRGWQSWSLEEKEIFFRCLKEFGRDFDNITTRIKTKSYEQVRHFYYRVIKKVNKILKPSKIDNKDPREVLTALLCFWDVKRGVTEKEEYTREFAISLRELIAKRTAELQKDEGYVNNPAYKKGGRKSARKQRPPRLPFNEKQGSFQSIDPNEFNSTSALASICNDQFNKLSGKPSFPLSGLPLLPGFQGLNMPPLGMNPYLMNQYQLNQLNQLNQLTQLSQLAALQNLSLLAQAKGIPLNMLANSIFANPVNLSGINSFPKNAQLPFPKPEGDLGLQMADTSIDGLSTSHTDLDEIACKNFYNQFENSLPENSETMNTQTLPDPRNNNQYASFSHLFRQ